MDYRPAEFVRFVGDHERLVDLLNEAKADTWTKGREHALLTVQCATGHQFVLVRGGADGIELMLLEGGNLGIEIDQKMVVVIKLAWHIHPEPTGPSDHDRHVLELLNQESSMLYEIRGLREGSRFYRTTYGRK